ncbi:DUF6932 family protein [Adhaeribacter aquaticus]|uniref:DUF6932 family protein n=1 Tax=Adhaeribacter aquaticus TaxID=299567 RepID=UPI00047A6F5B|nr:hypothetical protein [Adhaeribacter aquaticus]
MLEDKEEFLPLFPPGFYEMTPDQLEDIFVNPFINQERRIFLVSRLKSLFKRFSEAGIPAEIWIDGSFSTFKESPGDVDLIFFYSDNDVQNLTPDQISILKEINDRTLSQIRYNCDVFLVRKEDMESRSYWRGWFCFTRDEQPKGIARIWYDNNIQAA